METTAVRGRLRAEIKAGTLNLDAERGGDRFRFQFYIDGRSIGAAKISSPAPNMVRIERVWNLLDRKVREFDGTPPNASVGIDEYTWVDGERVPFDRVYLTARTMSLGDSPSTDSGRLLWERLELYDVTFVGASD